MRVLARKSSTAACIALAGALVAGAADLHAQAPSEAAQPALGPQTYDVKTMTFDLWCQETQRLPADRCAAHRPDDVKTFEDYRAAVERYELQYLKQVEQEGAAQARGNRDPGAAVRTLQDAPSPR